MAQDILELGEGDAVPVAGRLGRNDGEKAHQIEIRVSEKAALSNSWALRVIYKEHRLDNHYVLDILWSYI